MNQEERVAITYEHSGWRASFRIIWWVMNFWSASVDDDAA
jgi:hypothetical protein